MWGVARRFFGFLRGELGKLEKEERVVLTTFMCCLTWCAGEERKHNKKPPNNSGKKKSESAGSTLLLILLHSCFSRKITSFWTAIQLSYMLSRFMADLKMGTRTLLPDPEKHTGLLVAGYNRNEIRRKKVANKPLSYFLFVIF